MKSMFDMLLERALRAEELVANLRAENVRLRQQRDAANAQLDWLIEQTGTKRVIRSNMDECE